MSDDIQQKTTDIAANATDTVPITTDADTAVISTDVTDTEVLHAVASSDADAETDNDDRVTTSIPQQTSQQVPLYSTMPPMQGGNGGTPTPVTNYVQVPVSPQRRERPVIQKIGPSPATIVFGVCLVLLGIVPFLVADGFPGGGMMMPGGDPRVLIAGICAVLGGVLVIVAVVWAVSSMIRSRREAKRGGGKNGSPSAPLT